MTEYNKLFREAFDRIEPKTDEKSFIQSITERNRTMKNDEYERRELHEITVPHVEYKPRKAPWIAAIAGFTAAAAGLGFFAGTGFGRGNGGGIEMSPLSGGGYSDTADNADTAKITTSIADAYSHTVYEPEFNGLLPGTYRNKNMSIDVTTFECDYHTMTITAKSSEGYLAGENSELILLYGDRTATHWSVSRLPLDVFIITSDVDIPPYETTDFELHYRDNGSEENISDDTLIARFSVKGAGLMTLSEGDTTAAAEEDVSAVTTTATLGADYTIVAEETAVVVDVPDETTTATEEWHDIAAVGSFDDYIYDFSDISIRILEWEYDGRIFKCDYEFIRDGKVLPYPDDTLPYIAAVSKTNPRRWGQLGHSGWINNGSVNTVTEVLDIPDGETETITLRRIDTRGPEVSIEDGPQFTITGSSSSVLKDRIGVDLAEFGLANARLEWVTLSPFGLQLDITSTTDISDGSFSDKLDVELTDLEGNKIDKTAFAYGATSVMNESSGTYSVSVLCQPNNVAFDLMNTKEISIHGFRLKKAEMMPLKYWDGLLTE